MKKKDLIFNLIILALFALFTLVTTLSHEIWADEAQAWLVARDLNLFEMIGHIRTEGHPILWYLLIFPFAKLNFSVLSMQLLNWFLALLGASYFVFKSPFNKFCKVSFLMSAGMLYWVSCVARSYSLFPILIFLLASFYPKRKTHPYLYAALLILIANTHVILFGFAAALSVLYIYETIKDFRIEKSAVVASVLAVVNLAVIFFYINGTQSTNVIVDSYSQTFGGVFLELVKNIYDNASALYSLLFYGSVAILAAFVFVYNKKLFFVFCTSALFQFYVYKFVWGVSPQRGFTLILVLIFCLWIIRKENAETKTLNYTNLLLSLILLLSFPWGMKLSLNDFLYNFSDGKNTAKFIEKNISKDAVLISEYDYSMTSISAYLVHRKFWSTKNNKYFTFADWQVDKNMGTDSNAIRLSSEMIENNELYLISNSKKYLFGSKPIYCSESNSTIHTGEMFKIYTIKENQRREE